MTKRIYLDYAATTPMDKEVKKAMEPYLSTQFGNPNSLHYFGQQARKVVDESREKVARAIGRPPAGGFREVIFTGSATESNNMALRGTLRAIADLRGLKRGLTQKEFSVSQREVGVSQRPRLIISAIEHESVLETARDLEREGVEVVYLPIDKNGRVNLKKLKESLDENTVLVSVMYANNEIGTVQDIKEISNIICTFRNAKLQTYANAANEISSQCSHKFAGWHYYPLFHTDAVQAFQFLNCNVDELGVDLMTLSGHKIYGPKGIGLLFIKQSDELKAKSYKLKAITTGGGQEFGLRSGTENVAGIVGFAKAVELAGKNREKEARRLMDLRNYFWTELKKIYPKIQVNGFSKITNYHPPAGGPIINLPNILNVYFPGHRAEDLLIKLDLNGVAVSSGSACASFSAKPSHVLEALGYKEERIKSSLRFSMGKFTDKDEIVRTLKILKAVLKK